MSPPKSICVDDHKKPILVSSVIRDLDIGETNIDKKTTISLKAVPSDEAIEHEDGTLKVRLSDAVQEKGTAEECGKVPMHDEKDADKFEFLATDTHTRGTPSSLCEKSNPEDQQHKISDTQSLSQKRKKEGKGSSSIKTSKRCRTSLTSFVDGAPCDQDGSCCNAGKTTGVKTVGGGTPTKQTGNGACPAMANNANGAGTTAGLQSSPCGNCGGGGCGDGGDDDGNKPPKELKLLACDHSSPINYRKQGKANSGDMDVDGSNTPSQDSGMDIAGSPPTGTDVQMVSVSQPVARPAAKPPEEISKFLVDWHCTIIHLQFHNNIDQCPRCQFMNNLVAHVFGKNACICSYCKVWPTALKFHQEKCKHFKTCPVCVKARPIPVPRVVQHVPPVIQQTVLNVPTSGTSLDREEAVVYCDDSLQDAHLSHFKEHEDYCFKYQDPDKMVGKGGHGTVHDIVLNPQFKDKYPGFSFPDVVVKKTTLGADEKEVLKAIAGHPNFVKTYLVVNKTEVIKIGKNKKEDECKHRIFMQKCDKSLKDYIDKKWEKGEILSMYEAMHYWTQVLDAVVHLHTRCIPIIHKDIKAGNVLLTFGTNLVRAMLADYDAVKLLHNEYTQPGLRPQGTLDFIAPEVLRCQVHGRPADIYSMGKFLLELLCRRERKNTALALQKLKEMEYDLGVLIERCLQDNPDDRPTAVEIQKSEVVKKYSSKDIPMA